MGIYDAGFNGTNGAWPGEGGWVSSGGGTQSSLNPLVIGSGGGFGTGAGGWFAALYDTASTATAVPSTWPASGSQYLRYYAKLAAGSGDYVLDWTLASNYYPGASAMNSYIGVGHDGAVYCHWSADQNYATIDSYVGTAAGVVTLGSPFRIETAVTSTGAATIRVFTGANLHADHSSASNYTELTGAFRRFYTGSTALSGIATNRYQRYVGVSMVDWTGWPFVIAPNTALQGGEGIDALAFSTTGWVGPASITTTHSASAALTATAGGASTGSKATGSGAALTGNAALTAAGIRFATGTGAADMAAAATLNTAGLAAYAGRATLLGTVALAADSGIVYANSPYWGVRA